MTALPLYCRSGDLPHQHRSKSRFAKIIAIIPGPDEPGNLDAYFQPLLEDLRRYGPGSESAA